MRSLACFTPLLIACASVPVAVAVPVFITVRGFDEAEFGARDALGNVSIEAERDENGDGVIDFRLDAGEEVGVRTFNESRTYVMTVTAPDGATLFPPVRFPLFRSETEEGESLSTHVDFSTLDDDSPMFTVGQEVGVTDGTIREWPALIIGNINDRSLADILELRGAEITPFTGPTTVFGFVDVSFVPEPATLVLLAVSSMLALSACRRRSHIV